MKMVTFFPAHPLYRESLVWLLSVYRLRLRLGYQKYGRMIGKLRFTLLTFIIVIRYSIPNYLLFDNKASKYLKFLNQ